MFKLVLGLEVHIQLNTQSKMFCYCSAKIWGAKPNTHVCPACLGLPGALPVPNREAVKKAQMLGLALGSKVGSTSHFDRKHYFYPDLPKGYQISQYKKPLCEGGALKLNSGKVIELERVHLEEDTAKSFHEGTQTLIDFNKSGIPLVEVVTKPVFTDVGDAVEFGKKIQNLVRYLEVSDADMEKGQMRLETNISLRTYDMEKQNELPKYKVEVKNINSFKFMKQAVEAEVSRQREVLERGEVPKQENRGFIEKGKETVLQRGKEEAHDYRYFPEPDIPLMSFDEVYIDELKRHLPELPQERYLALLKAGLSENVSDVLSDYDNKKVYEKFGELVSAGFPPTLIGNSLVNKKEFRDLTTEQIGKRLRDLSKSAAEVADSDDNQLDILVNEVTGKNPGAVKDYKKGKLAALEFLLGLVMRSSKGKANADKARRVLISKLQ